MVKNLAGAPGDPTGGALGNVKCNLKRVLSNLGTGFALRLDGGPGMVAAGSDCPLQTNQAINAKFKTVKVGGIKSASLQFTVRETCGTTAGSRYRSRASAVSKIVKKIKVHGKRRKVGSCPRTSARARSAPSR